MFAAREGDLESARIMLDAGVDINLGDVDNVTPLVAAIMNKQYTLAKFLIDRGADVNIVDAGGRTALYAMIDIRNEDWTAMPNRTTDDPLPTMEVVKAIIDHGAKLDVPLTRPLTVRSGMDFGDNTLGAGATPMMRAARAGDHEVIRLLLAKGANRERSRPRTASTRSCLPPASAIATRTRAAARATRSSRSRS